MFSFIWTFVNVYNFLLASVYLFRVNCLRNQNGQVLSMLRFHSPSKKQIEYFSKVSHLIAFGVYLCVLSAACACILLQYVCYPNMLFMSTARVQRQTKYFYKYYFYFECFTSFFFQNREGSPSNMVNDTFSKWSLFGKLFF